MEDYFFFFFNLLFHLQFYTIVLVMVLDLKVMFEVFVNIAL